MKEALQNIRQSADALIAQAADAAAVDELRVRFLGKKGELTAILKQMGRLSAEERPSSARWPTRCARPSQPISRAAPKSWKARRSPCAPSRGGNRRNAAGQSARAGQAPPFSSRCWAS